MMPNITRGAGARGLVRYLSEDGRVNEHVDQRIIDGSLGQHGDLSDKAFRCSIWRDLDAPKRAYPQVRNMHQGKDKPIWHCSLSLKAGETPPTDQQWSTIARDFMQGMGFPADSRWVVAAHGLSRDGNPHIHIAASLITESGNRVSAYLDWPRSQRECMRLEHKYGLNVLESRVMGVSTPGLTQREVARQRQTGEIPSRIQLRDKIRAAYGGATSETVFFDRLRTAGMQVRTRRDEAGSVTGYAVALPGENVWFPASTLGHDLTIESLRRNWKQTPTQESAGRNRDATYKQATADLQRLTAKLPTLDARGLADAAHTVSGALAAANRPVEARQTALLAGQRHTSKAGRRVAMSTLLLVMSFENSDASPGQQAVIRALLRTAAAIQAAHHQMVQRRRVEGTPVVDQQQGQQSGVMSRWRQTRAEKQREAQARLDERQRTRAAQDRTRWDASTIAKYRIADDIARNHPDAFQDHSSVQQVTTAQAGRIVALANELYRDPNVKMPIDTFRPEFVNSLDVSRATALEKQLEFGLGAEKVKLVDASLVTRPTVVPDKPAQAPTLDERIAKIQEQHREKTRPQDVVAEMRADYYAMTGRELPDSILQRVQAGAQFDVVKVNDGYGFQEAAKTPAVQHSPAPVETTLERLGYQPGDTAAVSAAGIVSPKETTRIGMKPPEQWATGAESLTPGQRGKLLAQGFAPADIDLLTKSNASRLLDREVSVDVAIAASEDQRAKQPSQRQAGQQQAAKQEVRPQHLDAPHQTQQQRNQRRGA